MMDSKIGRVQYAEYHEGSTHRVAAIIEIGGIRFYTVTPGSTGGRDKINRAVKSIEEAFQKCS